MNSSARHNKYGSNDFFAKGTEKAKREKKVSGPVFSAPTGPREGRGASGLAPAPTPQRAKIHL